MRLDTASRTSPVLLALSVFWIGWTAPGGTSAALVDDHRLPMDGGQSHGVHGRSRHRKDHPGNPYGFEWQRRNSSSPLNHEVLPEFAEPVPNVTAIVGRTVKLPCVVNNLGQYRVAWIRVESKTILTIHRHVITQNYRVHLTQSDSTWLLVIEGVRESDRGAYMCQINTIPMRSQIGFLDVLVPPDIVGSKSSSDVLVREGSNVTLVCRAKGYPAPQITWRREDGLSLTVGNWQQHGSTKDNVSYEGDELSITKVSRLHMGPYLCIASNGVPSPVSRRILLQVHFPPMIWIPNQLIGAPLGGEVVMDCNTESFPMSINYWTLEGGDLIADSPKYTLNRTENVYKVHMRLKIRHIAPEDFGAYRCFAKNSLGSTEGSIRLYEIHVPPPTKVKEPSTARIQSVEEKGKKDIYPSPNGTVSLKENTGRNSLAWPTKTSKLRYFVHLLFVLGLFS